MDEKLRQHLIDYKIRNRQKRFVANFTDETNIDDFLDELARELNEGADLIIFKTTAQTGISLNAAKKAKLLAVEFDATFLIYDRADIAFLTESDGLAIDKNSISETEARKILGENSLFITIC